LVFTDASPVLKSRLEEDLKPDLLKFENRIKTGLGKKSGSKPILKEIRAPREKFYF